MFSEREEKIIKIIGLRKISFAKIAEELFKNEKNKPFDQNITVCNSVNRIIKKCINYENKWSLGKIKEGNKYLIYKTRM